MTQKEAIDILKLGHITFLTGGAGTGKTYVLNQFIKYLQAHSVPHFVTASTGIAATHIGGTTIHSYSGIGIKDRITDWDLEMMSQNEKLNKRISSTKVLIIDEISMLHASRLDMLDKILKHMKKTSEPFGGIQIIFCGDFFQLPPVVKNNINDTNIMKQKKEYQDLFAGKDWGDMNEEERKELQKSNFAKADINIKNEYAFNSSSWQNSKPVICYLTENYRQADNTLTNILNMIRSASEDIYDSLESLNETKDNELINPVKLYSHNRDVDNINNQNYKDLKSNIEHQYSMLSRGKKNLVDSLKQNILAPEILKLKIGTKVMFIKNEKTGKYQNGTLGIVEGFEKDNYPIILLNSGEKIIARQDSWQIKDDGDNILAEVSQLPLRYAWAITVHKSQGMTLDEAEIDLSAGFGYGMGYVALSRVRSLAGLKLHGLNNQALQVANHVLEYDKTLKEKSKQARSAIQKYDEQELGGLHKKNRIKMGGLEQELTTEEIEKKSTESAKKIKEDKMPTQSITLKMILDGKNIKEISQERDLKPNTIIEHVCDIVPLPEFKDVKEVQEKVNKIINQELEIFFAKNKENPNLKTKTSQKKFIKQIKNELNENEKMKPVFEKYSKIYTGLDYQVLKLMRAV